VRTATTALERVVIALASLALSIGLIALMSGYFAGHDPADVTGSVSGPGQAFPDQGHAVLRAGQARPRYDSSPPTSGPHVAVPVQRDGAALSDDQLLQALQTGNVVFMYGTRAAPPGLPSLARALAPPFSPGLAAAGQAVILARRSGIAGVLGLAWAHLVRVAEPTDPLLRSFANFWLGRGAPAH
jgi:Protein of unknown function (DUF3105)